MQCPSCNNQIPDNASVCPTCGAPVNFSYQPNPMSKDEFYHLPMMKSSRSSILGSAVVIYFCAGISFLVNVLLTMNLLGIIDVALLIGLGLGIQLGKSRACAVITMIYSLINVVVTLITTGVPGGWFVIVAGIFAIIGTFKFRKAWDSYLSTGMLPQAR